LPKSSANSWFNSYKIVQKNGMAIQFLVRFSNGYNKMVAENGSVLGWLVLAEINQPKEG
jgi:hypothetical protein